MDFLAQIAMPSNTRAEWGKLAQLSLRAKELKTNEYAAYPIYQFSDGLYLSLIGKLKPNPHWQEMFMHGVIKGSVTGQIVTIKVPLQSFSEINFGAVFSYIEIPEKISPDLDKVIRDVRVDSVQNGWGLPSDFTGKDVLIGVTDWGFDYTHPMFYDTLYEQSRIVAAWDQYKIVGNYPNGFSYGAEYNTAEELLSAQSDTSNIYSYATHGTHVAGIAGGSGALLPYRGMAPEAGFLFATFLVDAASVIDAFHWMHSVAQSENKRLVINMSWGLHYLGTLDGNSLLSQAINQLSEEGVVFVSSAGNNGDVDFHIKKTFSNDVMTSRIQFYPYSSNEHMWGQSITIWGEENHSFSTGISIYNALNVLLDASPIYHAETASAYLDSTLIIGNDTIFFNLASEWQNPLNARPHMRLRIKNTNTALRVVLNASADDGTVHFWNVVELDNGVGNWGQDFISFGETTGAAGDRLYGIAEPACASGVIAVAAYSSEYINVIGNLAGGQLASFTSTGPLMNEIVKPDIAAPGVSVASSISSFTDAAYSAIETISFNGNDYDFARFSGTSMSSPCVAGIVALLLEANSLLTSAQIKEILQLTARNDNYTGVITSPGHVRWGMGKVNALHAVQLALATVGLNTKELYGEASLLISPNPTNNQFVIGMKDHLVPLSVNAIDLSGKSHSLTMTKNVADASALSDGYYIIEVQTEVGVIRGKLIVQ